jgi:nitrogen fixation protein NifU and related proteins
MDNLDDLYREIILDHYRNPRNRGELPSPPARCVVGHNPLCGDEFTLTLTVEEGVIRDVKLTGHGCSISVASSSIMSQAVKGQTVDVAHERLHAFKALMTLEQSAEPIDVRSLGEIAALSGVSKFPARIKCATLAWNTLAEALDQTP